MSAPARPLGIRELIDSPVHVIRAHFRPLIRVALIGEALAAVPLLIYQLASGGVPPELSELPELGRFAALTYGAVGVQWLLRILPTLALYEAARRALDGELPAASEAYAVAAQPRCFSAYVLRGLIVGLGFLLCGLPGVAAACLLALLGPVLVHEGRGGLAAMGRSRSIVWARPAGRFAGSILSAVLIAGGITAALGFAINTIAALPGLIWTGIEIFSSASQGVAPSTYAAPIWLALTGSALGVLSQSVVDLYPAVVFTLIYREALRRSEGEDIEEALRGRLRGERGG